MEKTATNSMKERKPKNIFVQGPIAASFIADSIEKHKSKTDIGGHSIFLGQVRGDNIDGKEVTSIEYTAYDEMAIEKMHVRPFLQALSRKLNNVQKLRQRTRET